jgi:formylglycine-generating enzyme required for sulfatase activity
MKRVFYVLLVIVFISSPLCADQSTIAGAGNNAPTGDDKSGKLTEPAAVTDAKISSLAEEKTAPPAEDIRTFTSPVLDATFALIPSGTFMMGSPGDEKGRDKDESPQHQVTISRPFYIQTTEVTQGQWRKVMGSNPSYFGKCGDNCPVETVSWNDAQDFIKKLNSMENTDKYRLPTEAEWEYAARAGATTRFYSGDSESDLLKTGWYVLNSGSKTHPVAQKPPNAWGLYDVLGNVWEWCQDWKGDYPSGSVTDPKGPSSGTKRVWRGGGWSGYSSGSRTANRFQEEPGKRLFFMGLRLVRTL